MRRRAGEVELSSNQPTRIHRMNIHPRPKTNFVAPVVAAPLPKTEAPILPAPPWVGRALSFDAVAGVAIAGNSAASAPRGRWDSARADACEFFIGLIPSRPVTTPTATQLELHFA